MKKFYLITFTLFALLTASYKGYATHIMGGDLMYECLGGNEYRVILKLYRDCQGVEMDATHGFDQTIALDAFAEDGGPFSCAEREVEVELESMRELSPICPDQQNESACNGGDLIGSEEYIYTGTVTLPEGCGQWTIGTNFFYRNEAITNLEGVATDQHDMYLRTTIDAHDSTCNASPQFTNPPVPYICNNYEYNYNHQAVDADGDSLVYKLMNPMRDRDDSIPFTPDFSTDYPVNTESGEFDINDSTGMITFTPTGDYTPPNSDYMQVAVLSVLVEEYRDGEMVGTVMRDIQVIVVECDNIPPYRTSVSDAGGDPSATRTDSVSFRVCAGDSLSFNTEMTDDDAGDVLSLSSNLDDVIPDASIRSSGTNPITGEFAWETGINDAGNYSFMLTVQDDACPIMGSQNYMYNIEVTPPITIEDSVNHATCSDSGSIYVDLETGPDNPQFNWQEYPDSSGNSLSGIPPGTYNLTIEDPDGIYCAFDTTFTVNLPPVASIDSLNLQDVTCSDSGAAEVFADNDTIDYEYSWNGGPFGNNSSISDLDSGSYSVTVRLEGTTCTADTTFAIGPPPDLTIDSLTMDTVSCAGDDGGAQLYVSSTPDSTYEYNWDGNGFGSSSTVNNLTPGNHSVTVRMAGTSCTVDTTFNLEEPPEVNIDSLALTDVTCSGLGEAVVFAEDTTRDYEYNWNGNGWSDSSEASLPEGNHSVSIRIEGTTCSDDTTFNIGPPAVVSIDSLGLTAVSCSGPGAAEIFPNDTTQDYEYNWNSNGWSDSAVAGGLLPGSHTVEIRLEGTTCTSDTSFTLDPAPEVNIDSLSLTDVTCSDSGSAEVFAEDTSRDYEYNWNGNGWSDEQEVALSAGTHSVGVRLEGTTCTDDTTFTIGPPPELAIDSLSTDTVSCAGNDGGAQLYVSSTPDSTYEYNWNGNGFGSDNTVGNLEPGNHSVTVRMEGTSCTVDTTFDLTEPPEVTIDSLALADVTCSGPGQAEVFAEDTTREYEYNWNGNGWSDSSEASLPEGTHSVSIRIEGTACMYDTTFDIGPNPTISIDSVVTGPETCSGPGTVQVYPSDTSQFEYNWNGNGWSDSSEAVLQEGSYSVEIRIDGTACTDNAPFNIGPEPTIAVDSLDITAVSCSGPGIVEVFAEDATRDYEYNWNGNGWSDSSEARLGPGDHDVSIRLEGTTCTADTSFALDPAPVADIDSVSTEPVTCSGSGSARVYVDDAGKDYEYSWDGGPFTNSLSVDTFSAGTHKIVVRLEGTVCMDSVTFTIAPAPTVNLDNIIIRNPTCDTSSYAEVRAEDPTRTYEYSWDGGSFYADSSSRTGLEAGTHTITIRLVNTACTDTDTFNIAEVPDVRIEDLSVSPSACFAGHTGEAEVTVAPDSLTYTYSWSGAGGNYSNNASVNNLQIGSHNVYIEDIEYGCVVDSAFDVKGKGADYEVSSTPELCSQGNGSITVNSSGSLAEIEWSDISANTFERDSLGEGFYSFTLFNSNASSACEVDTTIEIVNDSEPVDADFSYRPSGDDGDFDATEPVIFNNESQGNVDSTHWDFGDGATSVEYHTSHTYSDSGRYVVTLDVTSPGGCSDRARKAFQVVPLTPCNKAIPNAFSPNGDGVNDDIGVLGNVEDVELTIYNRWGEPVFQTTDRDERWDGTYRGERATVGVYPFVLYYTCPEDDKRRRHVGQITLVR